MEILTIRQGSAVAKLPRSDIYRLPVLNNVLNDGVVDDTNYLYLGQQPSIPSEWLLLAAEWASTAANDYVLPTNSETAEKIKQALEYYGVEEFEIANLKTASALRQEISELEESKKCLEKKRKETVEISFESLRSCSLHLMQVFGMEYNQEGQLGWINNQPTENLPNFAHTFVLTLGHAVIPELQSHQEKLKAALLG
jgi:hypothetical protein